MHTLYECYMYLEQFCISLFNIYFMHIRAKLIQRESVYYVFTSDFPDYKFFSKLGTEWKINFKMVKHSLQSRRTFQYPRNILVYQYFVGYLNMHKKVLRTAQHAISTVRDDQIIHRFFYVRVEYSKSNINDRYRYLGSERSRFRHRWQNSHTFWDKCDRSRLRGNRIP